MMEPTIADAALRALADHLWQSTAVAAAAMLLGLGLKRYRADLRYLVWLAASIKFLVPFAALAFLGAQFPMPAARSETSSVAVETMWTIAQPFAVEPVAAVRAGPVPATVVPSITVSMAVLAIWLAGSLVLAVRRWVTVRRGKGIARAALPIDRGREADAFARAQQAIGGRRVRLRRAASGSAPCLFGWVRPVLLWPDDLSWRLTDEQLDAIVAHELAHAGRHHNLAAAAHALVEILFWFHPLVWRIGAGLLEEREHACDEAVLRAGMAPEPYARAIVAVGALSLGVPAGSAGMTGSTLTHRIEAIMSNRQPSSLGRFSRALFVASVLALVLGPVFGGALNATPQAGAGRVTGVVTDTFRKPIAGATVTIGADRDAATTDEFGRFLISGIPAGEHELRIEQPGFRPGVLRIAVPAGGQARADAELAIGTVTESIHLSALPEPDPTMAQPIASGNTEAALLEQVGREPADLSAHLALAELDHRQERFAESSLAMARAADLIARQQTVPISPAADAAAGGDIRRPEKTRDVIPLYPAAARAAGVTGTVIIEATIAADGTVRDAAVVRGVPLLDEAALGAVQQWLYRPTTLNGVPVPTSMTVMLRFSAD